MVHDKWGRIKVPRQAVKTRVQEFWDVWEVVNDVMWHEVQARKGADYFEGDSEIDQTSRFEMFEQMVLTVTMEVWHGLQS